MPFTDLQDEQQDFLICEGLALQADLREWSPDQENERPSAFRWVKDGKFNGFKRTALTYFLTLELEFYLDHPDHPACGGGSKEIASALSLCEVQDAIAEAYRVALLKDNHPDGPEGLRKFLGLFPDTKHAELFRQLLPIELDARQSPDGHRPPLKRYFRPFRQYADVLCQTYRCPTTGHWLDNYKLDQVLGVGANGVVYRAFRYKKCDSESLELEMVRPVALKLLLPGGRIKQDVCPDGEDLWYADRRERFRKEVAFGARLLADAFAPVEDIGQCDGFVYCTMSYVEGGRSVSELLEERQSPFDCRMAVEYAKDIAQALTVLAKPAISLIHRDINSNNVLIRGDDDFEGLKRPKAVLCDFGLAIGKEAAANRRRDGISGTPSYMAPEQTIEGGLIDERCDIYAVGALLYEMLAGRPPFASDELREVIEKVRSHPPVPPSASNPGVAPTLDEIVLRCLAKEPASRYRTAKVLVEVLEGWLEAEKERAEVEKKRLQARRWREENLWTRRKFGLCTAALAALGVTAGYSWLRRDAVLEAFSSSHPDFRPLWPKYRFSEFDYKSSEIKSHYINRHNPRGIDKLILDRLLAAKDPDLKGFSTTRDEKLFDLRGIVGPSDLNYRGIRSGRISSAHFTRVMEVTRQPEHDNRYVRLDFLTDWWGVDVRYSGPDNCDWFIVSSDSNGNGDGFVGIRSLKTTNLIIDLGKRKVGEPIEIVTHAYFWNGFAIQDQWAGLKLHGPTNLARLGIVFPEGQPRLYLPDGSPKPYQVNNGTRGSFSLEHEEGRNNFKVDEKKRWAYLSVDDPPTSGSGRPNEGSATIYEIRWRWQPPPDPEMEAFSRRAPDVMALQEPYRFRPFGYWSDRTEPLPKDEIPAPFGFIIEQDSEIIDLRETTSSVPARAADSREKNPTYRSRVLRVKRDEKHRQAQTLWVKLIPGGRCLDARCVSVKSSGVVRHPTFKTFATEPGPVWMKIDLGPERSPDESIDVVILAFDWDGFSVSDGHATKTIDRTTQSIQFAIIFPRDAILSVAPHAVLVREGRKDQGKPLGSDLSQDRQTAVVRARDVDAGTTLHLHWTYQDGAGNAR